MADLEEQLDPRVQVELEVLNTATDDINKLEAKLEEANGAFRATLSESTVRLKTLAKKLGGCIEKARPYYEALELARSSQLDCQRAAVQYQRANALHQAAKETIAKAEEMFVHHDENRHFDSTWQEVLNRAIIKVMEAEAQKASSEREHLKRAATYQQAEQQVQQLHRGLRYSISKSTVYFEEKTRVQAQLESQKEHVQQLQQAITASKTSYAQSLRRLEQISEQIHEQRRCRLPREPGVGAELPPAAATETPAYPRPPTPSHDLTTQDEQYWETLREKLTKLEASSSKQGDSGDSQSSEEIRERSVSGSSSTDPIDTPPAGTGVSDTNPHTATQEREALAQSSKVDSISVKGERSGRMTGKEDWYSDCRMAYQEKNVIGVGEGAIGEEDLVRRAPIGGCSIDMLHQVAARIENNILVMARPSSSSYYDDCSLGIETVNISDIKVTAFKDAFEQYPNCGIDLTKVGVELHESTFPVSGFNNDLDLRTAEGEDDNEPYNEINSQSEVVYGRCSPPPGQCVPSRSLCVIPEELDICIVPE